MWCSHPVNKVSTVDVLGNRAASLGKDVHWLAFPGECCQFPLVSWGSLLPPALAQGTRDWAPLPGGAAAGSLDQGWLSESAGPVSQTGGFGCHEDQGGPG